jgi:pyruvate kinase
MVKNDAIIGERKPMHLPGSSIDLPTITDQDDSDIQFGVKKQIDIIAVSFIRKAEEVEQVRNTVRAQGGRSKVYARIENHEGLSHFEEILHEADGIIIARGPLSMELSPEKVFIAQNWMIEKANQVAKPVIIQSHVLDSMVRMPKPTRGEAADVCQTVINGVDCVMLFNETAEGSFPINAVNALAKICVEGERTLDHRRLYGDMKMYTPMPMITAESVAASSVNTVLDLPIDLIVVLTETGRFARLVAKYRPPVPILALSSDKQVVKQLQTIRGVIGHKIGSFDEGSIIKMVNKITKDAHLCKTGQKVVFIQGEKEETADETNIVKIIEIE